MAAVLRVLVVEDGWEYIETLRSGLGDGFTFTRAGDGPEALALLAAPRWDVIFLDMCFDRSPRLLGDLAGLTARFGGDAGLARRYLEAHQGTFILAALRDAGCTLPVVFSYDFSGEPRRFRRLQERHGPLRYVTDVASPAGIASALGAGQGPGRG